MAYPAEIREQAIEMVRKIGPCRASEILGISRTTLYEWGLAKYPGGLLPIEVAPMNAHDTATSVDAPTADKQAEHFRKC